MKKITFAFLLWGLIGCQQNKDEVKVSDPIIVSGKDPASGAYFTTDPFNNPVLCWTAGAKDQERLFYSVYDKEKENFHEAIAIPATGISFAPETMNKVAFKKDGTIIAVFARKHPTEQNKFAGSLLFRQSFDDGKSWTKEQFVHTDTLPDNSRSYFDLAMLPDGEVGVVWLDSRFKKGKEGSALFFAKTKGKEGFQVDRQIAETVCQCCRTDIYVDQEKKVHVLYRDVEQSIKGQVRDFAHIVSADNGETFGPSNKISNDNWLVEGCPHTGASIGSNKDRLEVVWFTAGGKPGLYATQSDNNGNTFELRQLISETGRHPQIASVGNAFAIVWEESITSIQQTASHHGHHSEGESSGGIVIAIKKINDNRMEQIRIDEGGEFPVLSSTETKQVLVAYTKANQVIVRKVKF